MVQLLTLHVLAALVAPVLIKQFGRKSFWILALAPASAAIWALAHTRAVLAGNGPSQTYEWLPFLGLEVTFRLDTLSWLMTIIVGGVGALVLFYCARYFAAHAVGLPRFAGVFTAFAGAMLGLVTTDNTVLLYTFWEFTTVFCFLLIGHYHSRQASRRAAMQAILTTSLGGLSMLGGLMMLGLAEGGSFTISELVESARNGTLQDANPAAYINVAIALVLLGALTKAAQVPFHYWLPAAMAAPTPVSAYLHAAAMVKAGVYLVARLAPGFAGIQIWQIMVVGIGLSTMLLGGYRSLRQHDLKLILAFGTVSQLGFIIVLVGHGERAVALAGITMLLSHAIFKACLFLTVGVIDQITGTRDIRDLSGIGRQVPVLAVTSGLAIASMAGLPPTLGFVAKEAAFAALLESPGFFDQLVLIAIVLGSVLTFAYGLRWWFGAFPTKRDVPLCHPNKPSEIVLASPALLGVTSLVLGFLYSPIETVLSPHADLYPGDAGHLALWAGFGAPLALSAGIVVAGYAMFRFRDSIERAQAKVQGVPAADDAYRFVVRWLNNTAADVTSFFQRGSLPAYVTTILLTMVIATWAAILTSHSPWPDRLRWWDTYVQFGVAVVIVIATLLVATARRRMKAVLLLGLVGYGVALMYAFMGDPDLALTQAVVETVSLVVFVLIVRRMPPYFTNRPLISQRWRRVMIGAAVGITTAVVGVLATGGRIHAPVTVDYPKEVYEFGYGRNIVNVTLVDTRAWDTIGEISVLLAAATGVASLIFIRNRFVQIPKHAFQQARQRRTIWAGHSIDRAAPLRQPQETSREVLRPQRGQTWLPGSITLAPMRRSVILEIGARMVFHPILIFSLFLLFSGHNAPGGGFAGGVLAGIALVVRYLAGGRYELAAAAPVSPATLLGGGMTIATVAALTPVALGGTILQTTVFDFTLPLFGPIHLATALFFDIGVYLIVIGLILDILRSMGSQIDRQSEAEGQQAPEVAHDYPAVLTSDAVAAVDLKARVEAAAEKLSSRGDAS